jgi:hypothetical protein
VEDIRLPQFVIVDDFGNLRDIVKLHIEKDLSWSEELENVTDNVLGHVPQFIEDSIKARAMLQQLSTSLVKYRAHVVNIKEIYSASMKKHRFPYTNTCEELFIQWSKYEKSHPFKMIS